MTMLMSLIDSVENVYEVIKDISLPHSIEYIMSIRNNVEIVKKCLEKWY